MKPNNNNVFISLILTTILVYALTAIPLLIISNVSFKQSFSDQFTSLSLLYKQQIEFLIKNKKELKLQEFLNDISNTPHITRVKLINYKTNISQSNISNNT